MKIERKLVLPVSAALLSAALVLAGCSRELDANDEAMRAANEAAQSAAEATGAARTAVDDLVNANNALLLRVDELESRLANAEGGDFEREAAPARRYQSESSYASPSRGVTAEYEDLVPVTTGRGDYRYQTQPVLADTRTADWSEPSRFRDVPRPSSPPREYERQEPTYRRLTVESGTPIAVKILDPISTRYSRPGDSFNARLASDLLTDSGRVAIREGAEIVGHVAEVKKSQRIGGRASLLVTMDRIELPDGSTAPLEAAWSTRGKSQTPKDAATIGGATVGGAILGRILDDGDGDVIGGLLGAAAGTAVAHQKVGKPIVLGRGAVINMHTRAPIEVRVRNN